jgi:hypothetical protein
MASGHANRTEEALANPEPSTHGTTRPKLVLVIQNYDGSCCPRLSRRLYTVLRILAEERTLTSGTLSKKAR